MNCIYLKIKLNHSLECRKLKKIINIKDCANCAYKEYKMHTKTKKTVRKTVKSGLSAENCKALQRTANMLQRSSKLRKLEKNRFSLFTDDLKRCYMCPNPKEHLHEVCFGKNRKNSMKYGLVLPLCEKHHRLMHSDSTLQLEYKKRGQALFNKVYPDLNFIVIFHENYLD